MLELPLREHAQLLAFLLSLHGSQPSLRQQRFTFQLDAGPLPWLPSLAEEHKAGSIGPCASTATDQLAGAAAPCTPPLPLGAAPTMASAGASTAPVLTSSVFDEAPDPYALTNGSSAVAVLLPGEVGLPAQAFAGSEEVQVRAGAAKVPGRGVPALQAGPPAVPGLLVCCPRGIRAGAALPAHCAVLLPGRAARLLLQPVLFPLPVQNMSIEVLLPACLACRTWLRGWAAGQCGTPPRQQRCRRCAAPPGCRFRPPWQSFEGMRGEGRARRSWASR